MSTKSLVLLSWTIFLPITLFALIPVRSHPESHYTFGMALLGGLAWLAIPAFLIGLVARLWWLVGLSVYLFAGQYVVGNALRETGRMC